MKEIILSLLVAAAVLAGCSRQQQQQYPNSLLAEVPADTPYLLASGEPMPKELTQKFRESIRPVVDDLRARMDEILNELTQSNPDAAQQLRALVDEVMKLAASDGFKQIGLTRDDQLVIYGDGLYPVMRLTLTDAKAFRGFIDRLMSKAGIVISPHSHQGSDYWRVPLGGLVALAGIGGGEFDVALTTPDRETETLTTLFDSRKPDQSVAQAGTVGGLVKQYGFTDNATGFVDSVRLAELVLGNGSDTPGLLADLGVAPDELTPECRAELRGFAGKVPRLVFGYDRLAKDRVGTRGVVEMAPDLAADLEGWTAPVPGLGAESDARLTLGFGLDAGKAMATVKGWMNAAAKRQFACQSLAQVDWAGKAGQVNSAPLFMVGNPKGMVLRLDDVSVDELPEGQALSSANVHVKASVVMLLDNAQTLPAMAKSFVPQLQSVDIPKDGTPVQLPKELLEGIDEPAFAAANDTVLGLSIGDGGEERLKHAMAAKHAGHPPVFHMAFDAGWFYGQMAKWLPKIAEETSEPDSDTGKELNQQARMMEVYAKLFDRLDYRIEFTDRGIEFVQDVTMQ